MNLDSGLFVSLFFRCGRIFAILEKFVLVVNTIINHVDSSKDVQLVVILN